MSSSESPEDELRRAEDPPHLRKRKTSKIILDALGVSCQVAPITAGEVALLNPLAAEVDPVAANVVAEIDVAVTIASPTTNGPAVVSPGYSCFASHQSACHLKFKDVTLRSEAWRRTLLSQAAPSQL